MEYDSLLSVIKRRRSIRSYRPDPVPTEDIMKVLEAARWAPSGNNSQPWEFVVVRSREKMRQVVGIFAEQSERLRKYSDNFKHAPNKSYLLNAAALVFVCGDPRFKSAYPRSSSDQEMAKMYRENAENIYIETVSAAVCNIILAATSLGLGTVWLTGSAESITGRQLKVALKVPEALDILCCIPLGYPSSDKPSPRTPRPLEDVVHFDEFDDKKWRSDEDVKRFVGEPHVWSEFYRAGRIPSVVSQ
ncbi:MAG: nitroreductase family protein [Dehalococcoidia bacterium]|nr:nitroreductase family protein [Dehalococcoidia bacterium]